MPLPVPWKKIVCRLLHTLLAHTAAILIVAVHTCLEVGSSFVAYLLPSNSFVAK